MKALINGKLITGTGEIYEKGTVLFENGKIVAAGETVVLPKDCEIVDVTGKWITPGLIDCHTHPNLQENPGVQSMSSDANEWSDPVTPYMRIEDAINPGHLVFEEMRKGGFTAGYAVPGSANVIGGTGIAYKTKPVETVKEMVIPDSRQMKMAMGENPKRIYGERKQAPVTRMGTAFILRQALEEAKAYVEKRKEGKAEKNLKMEAMAQVVQGKMRCRVHAHRADDMVTAWEIGKEYGLDMVIEHASDAGSILHYLKENQVPLVIGPIMPLYFRTKQECWNLSDSTPKRLAQAGIPFAMTKDGCEDIPLLRVDLGLCIAKGLPWDKALAGLTSEAARVMQMSDRIGTLQPGKDADIAVWSGDPFCNYTLCEKTIIDGEIFENQFE